MLLFDRMCSRIVSLLMVSVALLISLLVLISTALLVVITVTLMSVGLLLVRSLVVGIVASRLSLVGLRSIPRIAIEFALVVRRLCDGDRNLVVEGLTLAESAGICAVSSSIGMLRLARCTGCTARLLR